MKHQSRHQNQKPATEAGRAGVTHRRQTTGSGGFTLLELIVTVAIAGILIGIATPSFNSLIVSNRIAGLSNELSGSLTLAYSEAVKRSRRVTVCKSTTTDNAAPTCNTDAGTDWSQGWIVFVDGDTQGTIDGTDERVKIFQPVARNASITGNGAFANNVSFQPTGWLDISASEQSFDLCIPKAEERIIRVGTTGRVKIESTEDICP